jgi:hypothetical protein
MTGRPRDCGSCNLCCKLLHVPDIGKPAQMKCWWTTLHGGCLRQNEKPNPAAVDHNEATGVFTLHPSEEGKDLNLLACATFECLWLNSQKHEEVSRRQPRHFRPDITHVVIGPQDPSDNMVLHIQVDPAHPDAWRAPEIATQLNEIIRGGARIGVNLGEISFELSEPF